MAVTNTSGTLISQQRYLPFGGERTNLGSISQTDYGYTGQRDLDPGMGGLMDYKARFYSPYLNHFIQPDTLIPDPTNPQAWNRYSYVGNRPINFNDPTGHEPKYGCYQSSGNNCLNANGTKLTIGNGKGGAPKKVNPVIQPVNAQTPSVPLPTGTPTPSSSVSTSPNPNGNASTNYPTICSTPMPGNTCSGQRALMRQYEIRINFDPSQADWVDVGVGVFGIVGDVAKFLGPGGAVIWGVSQMAELAIVAKDWDELDAGDPLGVVLELSDKFSDLGELHPVYGFIFNGVDIAYNLSLGVDITVQPLEPYYLIP